MVKVKVLENKMSVLTGFLWFQSLFRYLDGLLDMVTSQLQGDPGYSMGNYGETAL